MRVIVAGDRRFEDYKFVKAKLDALNFEITEIVSGHAKGVDILGEMYAAERGLPMKIFAADWKRYGKAAGPIRNTQMAEYGEYLVAVKTPSSRGTKNMIEQMHRKGKPYEVHQVEEV